VNKEHAMSFGKLRKSALVIAAAGALAVGGLFAGRLFAGSMPAGPGDHSPRHMFGRIARSLDLSADQKAQIKTILKSHSAEIQAQMAAGATARRALHDAIKAQSVDEKAIRDAAAKAGQVHADGAVLFAKIRAEVLPVLTADQKQKLQSMDEKMRSRGERGTKAFAEFLRSDS
jgi:Spy/CpxP family protein refolding chaperone